MIGAWPAGVPGMQRQQPTTGGPEALEGLAVPVAVVRRERRRRGQAEEVRLR